MNRRWPFAVAGMLFAVLAVAGPPLSVLDGDRIEGPKLEALVAYLAPTVKDGLLQPSDTQKAAVAEALRTAADELTYVRASRLTNPEWLASVGFVLSLAHQQDLPTRKLAVRVYEDSLRFRPDDRRTRARLGLFMYSLPPRRLDALPHLERAFELGDESVEFPIAMLLFESGQRDAGLRRLEHYVKKFPADEKARKTLQGVKDGSLKIEVAKPKKPPPV